MIYVYKFTTKSIFLRNVILMTVLKYSKVHPFNFSPSFIVDLFVRFYFWKFYQISQQRQLRINDKHPQTQRKEASYTEFHSHLISLSDVLSLLTITRTF